MKKPNILLITCDQMRADAMGCSGNKIVKTPNLDALAASGINFANAFTPYPVCEPARASITTGMYPHKCLAFNHKSGGEEITDFPVLGTELTKLGYSTYAMGKLHYHPYTAPGQPKVTHGIQHVEFAESGRWVNLYDGAAGLEDYLDYLQTVGWGGYSRAHAIGNNDIFPAVSPLPEEHCVDSWVAGRAVSYMQQHLDDTPDKPFFMWASFPKPHSPYDPPRPYDAMYDPRSIPAPIGTIEDIRARGLDEDYARYFKYQWDTVSDAAKQVILAHYYGLISFQDKQVGRMLDFLQQAGVRDNTIVIFTADHGDMMGDFGLYFKTVMYRGSINIPFIISYPNGLPANIVSDELVGLQDIFPTLLAFAGKADFDTDGQNLAPIIKGEQPGRESYVAYFCTDEYPQSGRAMFNTKEYKYIYNVSGGVEELYDMKNDPYEQSNLATKPEYAALLWEKRSELHRWCVENNHSQMLDGSGFKTLPKPDAASLKPIQNMFGRRRF